MSLCCLCGAAKHHLIGGEPTVRDDLPEIISAMKSADHGRRISVASNGQKLADLAALERLRPAGMTVNRIMR